MRSDREMLELAAKAAGIDHPGGEHCVNGPALWDCAALRWWRPLTDDGDALRLARRLNISTEFLPDAVRCKAPAIEWVGETCVPCDWDLLGVAHRRAIVRAAAEIGAKMQEG